MIWGARPVKRFQFRLEPLLGYRKMLKEQAQLELAKATDEMKQEQRCLADLKCQQADAMALFRKTQSKTVSIDELKSFHYFFDRKRKDICLQNERLEQAAEKRTKCIRILEEAAKNCEVVERLKTKRLAEFKTEVLSEEQKFLDEIGTQNFVRRN